MKIRHIGTFCAILFSSFSFIAQAQQEGVGIGTSSPNPHAILDIVSPANNKGVLIPRLTTSERTSMGGNLSTTDNGLLVYDSDVSGFFFWNGTAWSSVTVVQDLELTGNELRITNNGNATAIDLSAFTGTNTDNQQLSLAGTDLSITGGNSVDLSALQDGVDDADNDPQNEIQDLQLVGNTLKITNNAAATDIDLAPFSGTNTDNQTLSLSGTDLTITGGNTINLSSVQDGVNDADSDPTNEIQNLSSASSGTNRTININGGTGTTFSVADNDNNSTNEIQTISKSGSTVTLSAGGGSFTDDVNDADSDPANEIQTVSKSGNTVTLSGGGGSFSVADSDNSATNEIQVLSKTGSTVSLSNGGGSFTDDVNDADNDPANEIQTISKTGSTITLSGGGGSFTDDVDDADNDPGNEIQTVSKVGNTVTLSGGGGSFSVADSDNSSTNEIQTISKTGSTITLSGGGGSFTDDVDDADNDPANEIQTVSKVGTTVTLSGGGGSFSVGDNDNSSSNELQTLSIVGSTLSISSGNSVSLPTSSSTKDAFKAYFGNATTGFSNGTTQLRPDKKTYDLAGSYDESNFQYKIIARGVFAISGVLLLYQDGTTNEPVDIIIFVDGSERFRKRCSYVTAGGSANSVALEFSFENYFSGGEVVEFALDHKGSSKTLVGGDDTKSYISGRLALEDN